jgi:hypothetical protein
MNREFPGGFPFVAVGIDFLLHEIADGFSKGFVFGCEFHFVVLLLIESSCLRCCGARSLAWVADVWGRFQKTATSTSMCAWRRPSMAADIFWKRPHTPAYVCKFVAAC